jgi:hypothetical protein
MLVALLRKSTNKSGGQQRLSGLRALLDLPGPVFVPLLAALDALPVALVDPSPVAVGTPVLLALVAARLPRVAVDTPMGHGEDLLK